MSRMNLTTLLVVGEGDHEKAFVKHMKDLYDFRTSGQKIKIEGGDGGAPSSLIKDTVRKFKHASYDRTFILLDSDVEITQADLKRAKKNRISLLKSTPVCLEGMLLEVLGQRVPNEAQRCKSSLQNQLNGPASSSSSYAVLFPKQLLDAVVKEQLVILRSLLSNSNLPNGFEVGDDVLINGIN